MVVIGKNKLEEYKERFMMYVVQFKIGELWVDKKKFPSLIEAERFVKETGMTDFRIVEIIVEKTK